MREIIAHCKVTYSGGARTFVKCSLFYCKYKLVQFGSFYLTIRLGQMALFIYYF